jgi:hypothetical protein
MLAEPMARGNIARPGLVCGATGSYDPAPLLAAPLLIGGLNRSGTSLARQLVGSHPLVAIPPTELEFFRRVRAPLSRRLGLTAALALADDILGWDKVAAWGLDREEVFLRVDAGEHTARGVFVALLSAYAAECGKPRWGEKTTSYERHMGTLTRWFGRELTFVHMIRHPVSTYASNRWYKGIEHELPVKLWAEEWRRSVMTALVESSRREARYVVVRYEDLVRETERELARICDAAGVAYDDRMLTMADFEQVDNSSFAGERHRYRGGIREADDVVRAERIPLKDLSHLRATCRRVAELVGYDVDDESTLRPIAASQRLRLIRLTLAAEHAQSLGRRVRSRVPA